MDTIETKTGRLCMPPPFGCGKPIEWFRDSLSIREFWISGLCQACQDVVFSKDEDEDE